MADTTDTCGLLRLKSIGLSTIGGRKPCTLLQAARHNLREAQQEQGARSHIDPGRAHLNWVITGPPTALEVANLARERMQAAGVNVDRLRKDHVQAIELLFSLHAQSSLDEAAYFQACHDWAVRRFGPGNMLSAVVHHDEPAPHCHVLLLPLANGQMAAKTLKDKRALSSLRDSFYAEVASQFGLSHGQKRMSPLERRMAADAILARLHAGNDPCTRSALWQAIRDSIESRPEPYVTALGLSITLPVAKVKPRRTSTQIFTSPGKGAKHEPSRCS